MNRFAHRLFAAPGLGLFILLQGCGGGNDAPPQDVAVAAASGARVEGCVIDEYSVPSDSVPVRVLAADGRTLAHTTSGPEGVFVVDVYTGQPAAVAVDLSDGEQLQIEATQRYQVVDTCLVAPKGSSVQ